MDNRPIGMFDSGVGGLTVLKEYIKELPNEDFIYFGDTARIPYGNKSKETIIKYSKQIVNFLIEQNVKMIVIACGTASAQAFAELQEIYSIPIKNIITPVAKLVTSKNIGVIATKGTIGSHAWENSIRIYNNDAKILPAACPLFVPIVEEGFVNSDIAKQIVANHLQIFKDSGIDTLVLGCTHYPVLADLINNELNHNVNLVNVGEYSAKDTKDFLVKNNLLSEKLIEPEYKFYSSDATNSFKQVSKLFLDMDIEKVEKINIENY
jgi:glutamate racemase